MFPLSATASIEDYTKYNKIIPEDVLPANGGFEIYVKDGGNWNFVDYMEFDEFFRHQTCDLSPHLNSDQGVTLRIVQRGGEAAHIDTMHIGKAQPDLAPTSQRYSKLSAKDFDVIDAYKKSIIVDFKRGLSASVFNMVARIEGKDRPKIPFQFPATNTYGVIDRHASFYTYKMSADNPRQPLDSEPLFIQTCIPGTGHPTANTYGWVWNDGDYIYAYLDFVPDNTSDGAEDYAAMHIKGTEGVKSFRVSANEKQFGKPFFEYTGQSDYQHKTYNFKIPRAEVDTGAEALQLAFSAYGTAAPPPPEYVHEVLLDTNPSSGAGVPVEDADSQITIPGIDYRVQALVNETFDRVVATRILKWDEAPVEYLTVYDLGVDQGPNGMQAVEWGVELEDIDNPSGFRGYFHSSEYIGNVNDYTISFDYSIDQAAIPTLSEWGLIFFTLFLMGAAVWFIRSRSKSGVIAAALVVCMMVGIVFAAQISLDGNMQDWIDVNPVISNDEFDDQSGDLNEDIRNGYVTDDGTNIYFRIDYTGEVEEPF
jgi:hypothetical protein